MCSDGETLDRELKHIATAMEGNGYPKKFTEKAISRQLRRPAEEKLERVINEPDQPKMEIARIPYVDGLSQEIRRIARTAGVRCSFFMPNTLRSLYQAKDSLPQEITTNAVYSVTCKTCDAEYIGETKRAIRIREKEHRDAVRLGQSNLSLSVAGRSGARLAYLIAGLIVDSPFDSVHLSIMRRSSR